MKKLPYLSCCALGILFCGFGTHAAELKVNAGETYRFDSETKILDLESLILEDGATLDLNNNQPAILIRAKKVQVGQGVKIIGAGTAGSAGVDGRSFEVAARDCETPRAGAPGSIGGDGSNGVNLNIDWTIVSFGSLELDLRGGDAGPGGQGGNGQDADQNANCPLQTGGDAGQGGASGASGSGGNFTYVFKGLEDDAQAFFAKENTVIKTQPGRIRESGSSGRPGIGSAGRYVNKKTLAGNRRWEAGGEKGEKPKPAEAGAEGKTGTVTFHLSEPARRDLARVPNTKDLSASTISQGEGVPEPKMAQTMELEKRVLHLEAELKRLMARVSELEAKNK